MKNPCKFNQYLMVSGKVSKNDIILSLCMPEKEYLKMQGSGSID